MKTTIGEVEYDYDVRDLAAAVLGETNLKIVEAGSADEALRHFRELSWSRSSVC